MKTLVFQFVLLFVVFISGPRNVAAQSLHFVYIQTEDKQPFYALFQNRNIPSSSTGYVILSKLEDGTYPLRIGTKGNTKLQDYVLKINGTDLGFVIKDFGETGWGLLNLHSSETQISGEESAKILASLAAQKEAEEKRVADSVNAAIAAAEEAQRAADALQAEAVAQQLLIDKLAQEKRVTDSLNEKIAARETKWKADSLKAALRMQRAAEKAAAAKKKETVAVNTESPEVKTESIAEPSKEVAGTAVEEVPTAAAPVVVVPATTAAKKSSKPKTAVKTSQKEKPAEQEKPFESIEAKKDTTAAPLAEGSAKVLEEPAATTTAIVVPVAVEKATSKAGKNTTTKSKSKPPAKLSQSVSDSGLIVLYKDGADTINAFIPTEKAEIETYTAAVEKKEIADTVAKAAVSNEELPAKPKRAVDVASKKGKTTKPKTLPKSTGVIISSNTIEQPPAKPDTVAVTTAEPVEIKEPEVKPVVAEVTPTESSSKKKKTSGITSNNSNTKIVTVPVPQPASAPDSSTSSPVNTACKQQATDKDFYALRKKMVANDDPDVMISTAKKAFKEKCYSITQVRNLCVLFLSDSERYMFLDAVYPYTSDNINYSRLSDLLQDDYYLRRFQAMLK